MTTLSPGKTHVFFAPHKLVFGLGAVASVGSEAKALGGTKALVVTDPGVVKAGLLGPVEESLKAAGLGVAVFGQVEPEPAARLVDAGAAAFRAAGCDLVVGVGGGSSLDVAKGVAIMATNTGSVLDYCGMDLVPRRGAPKILVPTTSGTGSEITRVFVITDEAAQTKKVVYSFHCLAEVGVVDPGLTMSMPPSITADTGMDALVHAVETFVSVNATPFSDILAERAIGWIGRYLPLAWAKGSNTEARYFMSLAATTAGLAFASGGLGAVHGLSYVLGTEFHMSHGRSNAIMLPHVMKFNAPACPERYARVAELLGADVAGLPAGQAAALAAPAVERMLETMGIPYRLGDYDISLEDLPRLTAGGMKQSRLFAMNPRDLGENDVAGIYREAM